MTLSPDMNADTMKSCLEAQKRASVDYGYVDAKIREDRIDRLLDVLMRYDDDICSALMADYGYRSALQSQFAEVVTSYKSLKIARRNIRKWMKKERRHAGFPFNLLGAKAEVHFQPLGSIGIISPWNFPVNLTLVPLAGVLAAGNRAMIKPSELTPNIAALMDTMISDAFDPTEVCVVNGGKDVGQNFSALAFDHLIYTGGANVARHIMRAAADNLVPLTLELGGKSPVIIGKGTNFKTASEKILFGKIFNAGQVCLAPDTLYVPKSELSRFISTVTIASRKMMPDSKGHEDFVCLVNKAHFDRMTSYIDEAQRKGAEVISLAPDPATQENLVPVTLVLDPPETCDIVKEEIFGPLLLVKTYEGISEVVSDINRGEKPLALYYFGTDKDERRRVLRGTTSGGVTINDVIMHYTIDDLPFGGVGESGMGAYHGYDGFKQFSHSRSVYTQSRIDIGHMLRPPYGAGFSKILNALIKTS